MNAPCMPYMASCSYPLSERPIACPSSKRGSHFVDALGGDALHAPVVDRAVAVKARTAIDGLAYHTGIRAHRAGLARIGGAENGHGPDRATGAQHEAGRQKTHQRRQANPPSDERQRKRGRYRDEIQRAPAVQFGRETRSLSCDSPGGESPQGITCSRTATMAISITARPLSNPPKSRARLA